MENYFSMQTGNDDLLFGLPNTLDEAVETFIGYYYRSANYESFLELDEDAFVIYTHNSAGQFLRNSWFLWWQEGHKYNEWPATIPPLVKFFNDAGIVHADDMSSIILSAAWHKENKKHFDLQEKVKHHQDFWRSRGYPDGIPKNL